MAMEIIALAGYIKSRENKTLIKENSECKKNDEE